MVPLDLVRGTLNNVSDQYILIIICYELITKKLTTCYIIMWSNQIHQLHVPVTKNEIRKRTVRYNGVHIMNFFQDKMNHNCSVQSYNKKHLKKLFYNRILPPLPQIESASPSYCKVFSSSYHDVTHPCSIVFNVLLHIHVYCSLCYPVMFHVIFRYVSLIL